ncbi:MAG: hypothetical protein AAFY71_28255 [Bacteroidota bacterium]
MKKSFVIVAITMLFVALLSSCETPISPDAQITVRNTLQTAADPSQGGTGGVELDIETIFSAPAGTYNQTATVGEGIEFDDYLEGLYDINFSEDAISYELVAPQDHPIYAAFFRTLEAGTFDRYYFTFTEPHNIESGSSNHAAVSLSVISDTEIVVEISEGFSFNPGSSFEIALN